MIWLVGGQLDFTNVTWKYFFIAVKCRHPNQERNPRARLYLNPWPSENCSNLLFTSENCSTLVIYLWKLQYTWYLPLKTAVSVYSTSSTCCSFPYTFIRPYTVHNIGPSSTKKKKLRILSEWNYATWNCIHDLRGITGLTIALKGTVKNERGYKLKANHFRSWSRPMKVISVVPVPRNWYKTVSNLYEN